MTDLVLLVKNQILSVQTLPLVILGQFRGGGAGGLLINISRSRNKRGVRRTWSPHPPHPVIVGKKKKESQKEEKLADPPPPLAKGLDVPFTTIIYSFLEAKDSH